MRLLHLVATPRVETSNTLRISTAFLNGLRDKHPDIAVTTIDLFHHDVPAMAGDKIDTKYMLMSGGELKPSASATWTDIESTIAGFLSHDVYVITAPMWNFSIPYSLKFYIDTIVQPGYMFKYLPDGTPVGLVHNKKMVVIKTSGGDYNNPPMSAFDHHEPYLRSIFGFCGITDIQFIRAGLMDITPELREMGIQQAISEQVPAVLAHF